MYSDDGEYMEFVRLILIEGPSEQWLCKIENAMKLILKTSFKPCRAELKKMLNKRDKWLMAHCGQLCNACSLVSCKFRKNVRFRLDERGDKFPGPGHKEARQL